MKLFRGKRNYNEILPVINKAFNINFSKLMPKIYNHDEYKDFHYTVEENNEIVGAMAAIPMKYYLGDNFLNARGVANVGVLKKFRGKGVMDMMLTKAVEDAKAEDVDFMFLSGNRERYQRYGFETAGNHYKYLITKSNLRYVEDETFDFEKNNKR